MNNIKLNNRQKFIIDFAKKHESFQTKDVFEVVKEKFDVERITVVRDLSILEENGILVKKGKGRAVSYQISPQYLMIEEINPEDYFLKPFNAREAKPFFDDNIFTLLDEQLFSPEELRQLEGIGQEFSKKYHALENESPGILKREWERLIIEFSWKSSEIEGNTYTLLETETLIKDHQLAKGKNRTEAQMILNQKNALDFILNNPGYFSSISLKKIKKIHEILAKDIDIKKDFRNRKVGITGTIYQPLGKKEKIEKAMEEFVTTIENINNKATKAFFALIMISYIQPFEDGNKRTGRVVANAILHAAGYPMLSYRNIDAGEYKKAMLLFYEQNNVSYIKKIFIDQLNFSAENYFG